MTEPNTIVVVDLDGVRHWSSRQSTFVTDGLADGSLTEVNDAPVPPPGEDIDTGNPDDGPGDRQRDTGDTSDSADVGVAGATPGSGSGKRR